MIFKIIKNILFSIKIFIKCLFRSKKIDDPVQKIITNTNDQLANMLEEMLEDPKTREIYNKIKNDPGTIK